MILSLDTETNGGDWWHGSRPFYVTTCTDDGTQRNYRWRVDPYTRLVTVDPQDLIEIQQLIDDAEIIVGQNLKFDVHALWFAGLRKPFPWHKVRDTLVAGHILASNIPHNLTAMVLQYLGDDILPFEEALAQAVQECRRMCNLKSFKETHGLIAVAKEGRPDMPSAGEKCWRLDYWLPYELAALLKYPKDHPWWTVLEEYSNQDSIYTLALWQVMEPEIKHGRMAEPGDWQRFMDNMEVSRITFEMEQYGLTKSKSRSAAMHDEFQTGEENYSETCIAIARSMGFDLKMPNGTGVNNSIREFVFGVMKLPVVAWTDGGKKGIPQPAFNKDSLLEWSLTLDGDKGKFVQSIMNKRAFSSAITYLKSYDLYSVEDKPGSDVQRIHPNFNPVGTATTRLSSNNPNGQNLCVDAETELLTKQGWVRADQLEVGMSVAQYWKENGRIDFCNDPGIIHEWFTGKMHHLTTELHIDMMLTPNHRCLLGNRKTGETFDIEAQNFKNDYKQFHAGQYVGGSKSLTEWEVVWLCAVQADGHYIKVDGAEYGIRFSFQKKRKIDRLRECLRHFNVKYIEKIEKDGATTFMMGKYEPMVAMVKGYMPKKTFGPWLLDLDRNTLDLFCAEVFKWDGDSTREAAWTSVKSINADWVQIAQTLSGNRSTIAVRQPTGNDHYFVNICKGRDYSMTTNFTREMVEWNGPVYCVTVPSSYILIRRNGKVCVTGNSKGKELEGGKEVTSVRKAFGPAEGREWYSLDYENIELRIPAYFSGEDSMVELFERPNDPPYFGSYHLLNAGLIYEDLFWPLANQKGAFKDKYKNSWYKTLKNFGFAQQYDCEEKTGDNAAKRKGSFAKVVEGLPKLTACKQEALAFARKHGIVRTLPDLSIPGDTGYPLMAGRYENGQIKATTPWNYKIQGSAGWAKKKAMIRVDKYLKEQFKKDKFSGRMVLEIHDELLLDFPKGRKGNKEKVMEIKRLMEMSGTDIGIPLPVSVSFHPENWYDEQPIR